MNCALYAHFSPSDPWLIIVISGFDWLHSAIGQLASRLDRFEGLLMSLSSRSSARAIEKCTVFITAFLKLEGATRDRCIRQQSLPTVLSKTTIEACIAHAQSNSIVVVWDRLVSFLPTLQVFITGLFAQISGVWRPLSAQGSEA